MLRASLHRINQGLGNLVSRDHSPWSYLLAAPIKVRSTLLISSLEPLSLAR